MSHHSGREKSVKTLDYKSLHVGQPISHVNRLIFSPERNSNKLNKENAVVLSTIHNIE